MENKEETVVVEEVAKETPKPKKEKAEAKEPKSEVKAVKVEKSEKAHSNSTFKMAFTMLKGNENTRSGLIVSILAFTLSLFVLLVTLTVKAQTGFIMVALVLLIAYMIAIAILALAVGFVALMLTKNKLKQTCSLVGFILSIVSILTVVGSVLIIYLT